MAAQIELAELKKAVEEMSQKMDKQMVMVQGLVSLFTSIASQPDMGLSKEPSQAYHPPEVGIKLCSKDMFKDLAEFHEARTHPKEYTDSLFKVNAKGEDMLSDEVNLKGKRVHHVDSTTQCSCKASKGSTLNTQSYRARTQPRSFSIFEAPLSAVMEKLIKSGHLKPLTPTSPPKVLSAGCNPNAYCAFHQMPGHLTDACFRLRHEIQDLIDNGTVQVPSKPNIISNSLPQHNSDPLVGQISIPSTQINPNSTIFNPSHYIVPESQPKPIISIPFEPEVNMMAVGCTVETFSANTWIDSDEGLANERTVGLRSIVPGSTE